MSKTDNKIDLSDIIDNYAIVLHKTGAGPEIFHTISIKDLAEVLKGVQTD